MKTQARIAFVHPLLGGIDVYALKLTRELSSLGWSVNSISLPPDCLPYNEITKSFRPFSEIIDSVQQAVKFIELERFDIVAFHFGKNDVEQIIPLVLEQQKRRLQRTVYFVHYLSHHLLSDYLGEPVLQEKISRLIFTFFDRYVWFGSYAKREMLSEKEGLDGIVSFLPETHPTGYENHCRDLAGKSSFSHLRDEARPLIILPGYAANYKDHDLLLQALAVLSRPVTFALIGRGWNRRLNFPELEVGNAQVYMIDRELPPSIFLEACYESDIGVFPYRQPETMAREKFQGSGTLPNFLSLKKICVVLDQGCLGEYVGQYGVIVKKAAPEELATAIGTALNLREDATFLAGLEKHSRIFSIDRHAKSVSRLITELLN